MLEKGFYRNKCLNSMQFILWVLFLSIKRFSGEVALHETLVPVCIWPSCTFLSYLKKKTSMLAYREWYLARTIQIAALGHVSCTNQSVVFVLWFERCSNFNEVMGDSERAVRKMESSFKMRNIGFSVFLTYILPRFMRNAILLHRWKITDYL